MKPAGVIVLVVLAGWSVVWGQAAGKAGDPSDKAKSKADPADVSSRHAATIEWVARRYGAARKARTRQATDAILAEIIARIDKVVRDSPPDATIADRLGLYVLKAWSGQIKGCEHVRLHAWRLATGQGDQDDRKAVLAATGDVLKSLKTQVDRLDKLKLKSRRNMRVWIVSMTDFQLAEDMLRDAYARVSFCRGMALAAGIERTRVLNGAIRACSQVGSAGTAASRRATVLAARCYLALGKGDKALAALKRLLAAAVPIDASTVRAALLAGKCAHAAGDAQKARAYLAYARAGLKAISQPPLRALVDAEITIWAQSMASGKIDPAARGAELAAFAKRNALHSNILASLLGLSGWSGGALLGPALADTAPGGPSAAFYGTSSPVDDVVYVIDRSGSMVTVFDYVRLQMQLSIASLRANQRFHIILFADEKTIEGPGAGLVSATPKNKRAVVDFLEKDVVSPRGRTTALVALKRALMVLGADAKSKRRRMMLFLTDGELAGMGGGSRYKGKSGNEAVIQFLKDSNADGKVVVNTYLYTHGGSDRAVKVMKQIAAEHGGTFRAIGVDE